MSPGAASYTHMRGRDTQIRYHALLGAARRACVFETTYPPPHTHAHLRTPGGKSAAVDTTRFVLKAVYVDEN